MSGLPRHCLYSAKCPSCGYVLVEAVWVTGEGNPLKLKGHQVMRMIPVVIVLQTEVPLLELLLGARNDVKPFQCIVSLYPHSSPWSKFIWQMKNRGADKWRNLPKVLKDLSPSSKQPGCASSDTDNDNWTDIHIYISPWEYIYIYYNICFHGE